MLKGFCHIHGLGERKNFHTFLVLANNILKLIYNRIDQCKRKRFSGMNKILPVPIFPKSILVLDHLNILAIDTREISRHPCLHGSNVNKEIYCK